MKYTVESAAPAPGWVVTSPDGTNHLFAKLWAALGWIEKQLKS